MERVDIFLERNFEFPTSLYPYLHTHSCHYFLFPIMNKKGKRIGSEEGCPIVKIFIQVFIVVTTYLRPNTIYAGC